MPLRFHSHLVSTLPILGVSIIQHFKARLRRAEQFYREVRTELSNVTWPDRREILVTTVIVIIFALVFGGYLSLMDEIVFRAVRWIMQYFGATPLVR